MTDLDFLGVVVPARPPEPPWAWVFVALVLGITTGWTLFL